MLTSISPFGERARGHRWLRTVGWLTLGGVIGGAAVGAALGALGLALPGRVDDRWRLAALASVAAGAALVDLIGWSLPGHRQVDEDWLTRYRGWVYGLGFGFQFGLGFATIVNTALVVVVAAAAVLVDSVAAAMVFGAVFGAVRGLTVLANGSARSPQLLLDLHRRLDSRADAARRCASAVSALVAVVLAGAVVV